MSAVRFLAVGDLMADVVAHGEGHGARISLAPGGSAYNAAVCAAELGADASVAGRIGNDPAGRMLLAELERRGVHPAVGIDEDAPTGTMLVVEGEIRADRGANARYGPEDLPALEADAVLVSGYLPEATMTAALEQATASWVALDAARLRTLPAAAPVVIANEATARRLTGGSAEEAVSALAGGRRLACVTLGRNGALAGWDGHVEHAAAPSSAPGDPLGAGDAFAAALLVELARGASVPAALEAACRAGSQAAGRAALQDGAKAR